MKTSNFDMFMILIFMAIAPIYLLCGCIIFSLGKQYLLGLIVILISLTQFTLVAQMINSYIKNIGIVK